MEHRNEYEVVIPLSSLMLPDLKLKNLSTQLRIQWAESNVDILLEPQDGIEDAGELLEFVNKRVGSQKVPLWQIIKDVTDFCTSVPTNCDQQLSFYSKYYEVIKSIAEGGFGTVFRCRHKLDGSLYAVKLIPFSDRSEKHTFMELRALFLLHQNIVIYHKAWIEDGVQDALKKPGSSLHLYDTSDDTGESQSDASQLSDSGEEPTPTKTLYLLMELCKSTLADELAANRKFSGTEISQIFRATAEGLAYIHSKNLVHADISTDNIFFDFQGVAKIGDFGLAIEDDGISRAIGGKFKYLPPELKSKTMGKVVKKGILTKAFDVYALAVVMVELVYSVTSDMELSKLFETVAENGLFPQQTNMAVGEFDVVRLMLSSNPSDRPPAEEILNMIHVG